eukprot:3224839-Rhodomonas_salina.1
MCALHAILTDLRRTMSWRRGAALTEGQGVDPGVAECNTVAQVRVFQSADAPEDTLQVRLEF